MTSGLDAFFEGKHESLTVPEVAELLNMTKPGVYKWLKDGVIPGYKVGSTWFILRDELKQTLSAGANTKRASGPTVILGAETEADTTKGE
ncbi:helix-turn-helix domain-containing protein [Arthrobacter sp. BF1]|uniref:helix-turn-helix domain-containing protein n=1 Tax=Arthrobacter sp. BF1 TaxID=2821145 RepID=UPI00358E0FD4